MSKRYNSFAFSRPGLTAMVSGEQSGVWRGYGYRLTS